MTWPVLRTFIHFAPCKTSLRRCSSAPPEVGATLVVALPGQREDRRAVRSKKRGRQRAKQALEPPDADLGVLREFRQQALTDLWGLLVAAALAAAGAQRGAQRGRLVDAWLHFAQRVLAAASAQYMQDAVALIGEKRVERAVPRLRCTLGHDTFDEIKYVLFHREDEQVFHHLGVFRERGSVVEAWCADALLENAAMLTMLGTLERARRVKDIGAYQVFVAEEIPIITPWQSTLTMLDVDALLLRALGMQPAQYCIKHRGVEVVSRAGRFVDLGIYAGACLQVDLID